MDNFLTAIVSIVICILATILVSNHYFRRSKKKSLTPYIQFSTSVFRGVVSSIRDSLKIKYKEVEIKDLFEIQFLIANTGERAIRDIIKPLALHIPESFQILDASILHISPKGREIFITVEGSDIIFDFPLLNSGDFFISKILIEGEPDYEDFSFSISVDDLPPTLKPRILPPDLVETGEKRGFSIGLLIGGFMLLALGASLAGLIYAQWHIVSELWKIGFWITLKNNLIILLSCIFAALPTLLLLIIGPMMLIGAFTNFSFPKKRKFFVPSDHRRGPLRLYHAHNFHIESKTQDG